MSIPANLYEFPRILQVNREYDPESQFVLNIAFLMTRILRGSRGGTRTRNLTGNQDSVWVLGDVIWAMWRRHDMS